MSPKEAQTVLKWIEEEPARLRRYELEGGTRQVWTCKSGCGCNTEAHTVEEGRANLKSFARTYPGACNCDHRDLVPTGRLSPPIDFS